MHEETRIEESQGWVDTILELYRAYHALESGDARRVTVDGETYRDADAIRDLATESVLDVQIRGDWHSPGESAEPCEYSILLSTGGPALRLIGALDNCQAESPRLEHQNWGLAWGEVIPEADDWDAAATWFAGCFWYGD